MFQVNIYLNSDIIYDKGHTYMHTKSTFVLLVCTTAVVSMHMTNENPYLGILKHWPNDLRHCKQYNNVCVVFSCSRQHKGNMLIVIAGPINAQTKCMHLDNVLQVFFFLF